jgi:AcrR family transcriptional regulator
MLGSNAEPPVDEKEARAERTRANLIDAFIAIVLEAKRLPSAIEVSRHARCSLRTLFERFGSMQALGIAAFDKVASEHEPLSADPDPGASREERIRAIVERRAGTAEAWLPLWRLAFQHDYVPALRDQIERLEERWRLGFERVFEAELAGLTRESGNSVLIALEAITHPRLWIRLRSDKQVPLDEAVRLWIEAIDRLLPRPDTRPSDGAAH